MFIDVVCLFLLLIPCIGNEWFVIIYQQVHNFLFTQLCYIEHCFMQDHFMYFLPDNDASSIETCRSF
jgi:hypothetical protein